LKTWRHEITETSHLNLVAKLSKKPRPRLLISILILHYLKRILNTDMEIVGYMKNQMNNGRYYSLIFMIISVVLLMAFSGCRMIEEKLDNYLNAAHELWGFNGSVIVAWNGRVILNEGYGLADNTFNIPNTPQTKFFIGSITKQFTAACIMIQKERGSLQLDDPISRYLPDYPRPNGDIITIRHLLTHTSGLPNYTDLPEIILKRTQPLNTEYIIDLFKNRPLDFEPGNKFKYSNSGYLLLGEIIEKVSGQSYEAFLEHEILKPLGMNNSGYARREAAYPNRASGYTGVNPQAPDRALPVHFSVLHSAGAMYSTVEDMLKWDQALYHGKILTPKSIKEIFMSDLGNYGFGWFVETIRGVKHEFHDGFLDGFNTMISRWPDYKLLVVVFSNDDLAPVGKMAQGLAAIAFNVDYDFPIKREPISLHKNILAEYEGVYVTPDSSDMYISLVDESLYIRRLAQPRSKLLPAALDTFFYASDNTLNLIFYRDAVRAISSFVIRDKFNTILAERLNDDRMREFIYLQPAIKIEPKILDRYVGVYRLESDAGGGLSDFYLTVTRQDKVLIVSVTGNEAVALYPMSETEFIHKDADFKLFFDWNKNRGTTRCTMTMGQISVTGYKIE